MVPGGLVLLIAWTFLLLGKKYDSMVCGLIAIILFISWMVHIYRLTEQEEKVKRSAYRNYNPADPYGLKEPQITKTIAITPAVSVQLNEDAVAALKTMGVKKLDAVNAVRAAQEALGAEATVQQIIAEALRPK